MTTQQIAERLTQLSREGKFEQAQRELYHQDARSIEPEGAPGMHSVQGMDAIIKKGDQFQSGVETVHDIQVEGPLVSGNFISLRLVMDITMKQWGRQTLDELCVYEVKDGQVVSEQFFYAVNAPQA